MIFAMFLLGVLTIIAGVLPFLSSLSFVPAILTSGALYYVVIMIIGAGSVLYGFMHPVLYGMQKFMPILLGLITVLGGVLPLVNGFVEIIPAAFLTGWVYSLIIVGIGIVGALYAIPQIA